MKIIILANDNVAYSGILSYPIVKKFSSEILGIFIQDGLLNPNSNPSSLFNEVKKKSGLQYAIFLGLETLYYKTAVSIRRIFHMNDHLDDCYLETNSNLGKIFDIPVYKIKGSIHDKTWLDKIRDLKPDLIICIRYAEILKKQLLEIPDDGVINFHPSLLPKYRGLGPVFQALLHNENEIGFSFHYIDEDVDTGEIIKREKIQIMENESVSRLSIRTHIAGGYELLNIINNLKDKNRTIVNIQNDGSYFSWPEKKDVKKFLTSRKKYVELRDFFSLLFYNPKNFKKI
jgi:folate-dependent phosphoribosylglycinamide formyltransferase PurN